MAWSDFASLVAGTSPVTLQHFLDIRLALIERCDIVGDATQKTAATALSTTNPFNAAWINSARAIIEALLLKYKNPSSLNTSTGQWNAWTKQTLMAKIYTDQSGEPSGAGYSGGTYNWILRPTRIGTLVVGATMPTDTYSPWLEHIMGLYYMINELRWIELSNYATSSPYWKTYQRLGPSEVPNAQDAWDGMLGATPAFYANDWFNGINRLGSTNYRYQVFRGVFRFKYTYIPSGYPSGWDDAKVAYAVNSGFVYKFLGPWKIYGGTAADGAGATNWASGTQMVSFTNGGTGSFESHDLDDYSVLPISASAWYLRVQHGNDDVASVPTTVDQINDQPNIGKIIGKPTLTYAA